MITVMAPSLRRGVQLRGLLLLLFHFFLFLPLSFSVDAAELSRPVPEHRVCKALDIRNKLEAFAQLNDCQVIEGSLQILLFDTVNETEFAKISFPDLTEITDYLLLFRVNGLKSLGQLFPNLAVIRGENLFPGSRALIIFEMSSLQEINLYSLTSIKEGSVHIDKNPSLCFVNSVDWSKITGSEHEVLARSFKPENECPVCPQSVNGTACYRKEGKYLCWNRDHCQKICKPQCGTCNDKGQCCNRRCIGGCESDTSKCTACREFVLNTGEDDASKCVEFCPAKYLSYLNRRCITPNECINMVRPLDFEDVDKVTNTIPVHPYKIHNGQCLLRCPSDYVGNNTDHSCTKCNNTCKKECPGARIDSINLAEKLFGCTHITGSIEIQVRGGDKVVKSLADNLGMIEEIDGYLKVVRSFSLVSLNFLKNLKRIRGNTLESQRYSLIVLDNQNLQDLFDWSAHKEFQIEKGRLFFHFNPKLCLDKIEALRKKAGLPIPNDMEVASNSNGDKVACSVSKLEVNITKVSSKFVKLEWEPFEMDDPRKLLSYVIYYKETTDRNVNFYDGRDACGQDNWHVDDVVNDMEAKIVSHDLVNLEPYTLYAFYVKTYTIASEKNGAQSDIMYFTTKPSQPSEPLTVPVNSDSPNSLSIVWKSPQKPNGKIAYYVVYGLKHHYDPLPKDRDYCKDGVIADISKAISTVPPKTKTQKCKEPKDKEEHKVNETDEQARIDFENALHNKVYVRRTEPAERSRRSIDNVMVDKDTANSTYLFGVKVPEYLSRDLTTIPVNTTEPGTHYRESFAFKTNSNQLNINVDNLRHYTAYDIFIWACRERVEDDDDAYCGQPAHRPGQTEAKPHADDIRNITVLNTTSNSVTIMWEQPPDPNRMIVSVNIYYKREDSKNAQVSRGCISYRDFKNYTNDGRFLMHTISELYPGNYSLYLQACSLRGPGKESSIVVFDIAESSQNVALIVCLILLLLTVISIIGAWLYYKKIKKDRTERLIPLINPDYLSTTSYVPDEWEVPRKNVTSIRELGQGSFGMVYEGIGHDLKGIPGKTKCAVKTVNENATARERIEFLNEASVMKAFNTTHVVKLLGVVSQGQPALVIMELMAHGDLKTYLRLHRPENNEGRTPPSLKQILQMALEIADGMAYLEGKKFVHRDLAARNCMVSENLTVKIGDFGMTRDIYETDYYRKGSRGLLPVRWMSPESLKDGVFSSSSDAFSYGIVLWEMATLASQPYQGLSNEQVLRYVMEGGLMERPENCPDKLFEIMSACWNPKPGRRPTFMELCEKLLPDASEHFLRVSFYNSEEGAEVRAIRAAAAEGAAPGDGDDADASTPLNALPPDMRIVGVYATSPGSEHSDSAQSVHVDPNPRFYSISEDRTANGYAGQARNGKAQSQR